MLNLTLLLVEILDDLLNIDFEPEQIKKLLKIKWWEWEDEKINENIPLLCNDNINLFIDKHYTP